MSKSFLDLDPKEQVDVYDHIFRKLVKLGFRELTQDQKQAEAKMLGLSKPVNQRQEDAEKSVTLRKYYYGHFVDVHTTFILKSKTFSKDGRITIMIKRPSEKEGYANAGAFYFNRVKSSVDKLLAFASYFDAVLWFVQFDTSLRPMIVRREKIDDDLDSINFESRDGAESFSFFAGRLLDLKTVPAEISDMVREELDSRRYYRKHSTSADRLRDTKHQRIAQTPEKAVPDTK